MNSLTDNSRFVTDSQLHAFKSDCERELREIERKLTSQVHELEWKLNSRMQTLERRAESRWTFFEWILPLTPIASLWVMILADACTRR